MIIMSRGTALLYNALAALGPGLGIINLLVAWRLFGADSVADAWLLSLTVINVLNMIALLGVEQFLYCYSDKRAHAEEEAEHFAKTAILWSLLCGVVFAAICAVLAPHLIEVFASGFTEPAKRDVTTLLVVMLPQTAAAPLLHVTRQLYNAHERYVSAFLLTLWGPSILLITQLLGLLVGLRIGDLAWIVGVGGVVLVVLCLCAVHRWLRNFHLLSKPLHGLSDFIWKSVSMRSGHTLHNFLSAAIINSTLSTLPAGNVALFQYAKRFADGVSVLAVGPHGSIYHALLAKAWSELNYNSVWKAATAYLKHVFLLFVASVIIVWLALPYILVLVASNTNVQVENMASIFLLVSVWNGLIIFESVFVGILITANRAGMFILVNGLFVMIFFFLSRLDLNLAIVFQLPAMAVLAQSVSLLLFVVLALHLFRRHFS
jgi:hypothetical protein